MKTWQTWGSLEKGLYRKFREIVCVSGDVELGEVVDVVVAEGGPGL